MARGWPRDCERLIMRARQFDLKLEVRRPASLDQPTDAEAPAGPDMLGTVTHPPTLRAGTPTCQRIRL
jgi:hypothetical protein